MRFEVVSPLGFAVALTFACGNEAGDATESSSSGGTGAATGGNSATGGATANTGGSSANATGTACATDSAVGLRNCVSQQNYEADLTTIAAARVPGSAQWQAVQDFCATRFESLGFTVERQAYGTGTNVIGTRGTGTSPTVLISAHYDSVADCAGADDNASGVAGVLEAARVLSQASLEGRLMVACWDEEEDGLLGSEAYVARAVANAEPLTASFVFEMIGYFSSVANSQTLPTGFELYFPTEAAALAANEYRANFIVAAADESSATTASHFVSHATELGLMSVAINVPAAFIDAYTSSALGRSDHAPFWTNDYPAVSLTDTADYRNPYYHCEGGPDAVSTLDLPTATLVVKAAVGAVANEFGL